MSSFSKHYPLVVGLSAGVRYVIMFSTWQLITKKGVDNRKLIFFLKHTYFLVPGLVK